MIAVEMGFKMQEQLKAKGWRFCFAIIFSIITRTLGYSWLSRVSIDILLDPFPASKPAS